MQTIINVLSVSIPTILAIIFFILWINLRILYDTLLTKREAEHRHYYTLLQQSNTVFKEIKEAADIYYEVLDNSMAEINRIYDHIQVIEHIEHHN